MKLYFNFDDFEEANDEVTATSYYGGSFTVNGERFYATGNDRGEGIQYQIYTAVGKLIGRKLSEEEEDELSASDAISFQGNCEVEVDWKK